MFNDLSNFSACVFWYVYVNAVPEEARRAWQIPLEQEVQADASRGWPELNLGPLKCRCAPNH